MLKNLKFTEMTISPKKINSINSYGTIHLKQKKREEALANLGSIGREKENTQSYSSVKTLAV